MSDMILFQGKEFYPPQRGGKLIDITGKKFARLTVLSILGSRKNGQIFWRVVCECGNESYAEGWALRNGAVLSCGCYAVERIKESKTIHGMSKSPEHAVWRKMQGRCYRKTSPDYSRYGGRGILICDRWLHGDGEKNGFQCFYEDMGPRPSPSHQIDRKDNGGPYSPDNCEWASPKVQANNRRSNRIVTMMGRDMTFSQAVEMFSVGPSYSMVMYRTKKMGWSLERSLLIPITATRPGRPKKKAA